MNVFGYLHVKQLICHFALFCLYYQSIVYWLLNPLLSIAMIPLRGLTEVVIIFNLSLPFLLFTLDSFP